MSSFVADWKALADRIPFENIDTSARNGANGSVSVMTTVCVSRAVMACIALRENCQGAWRSCDRWNDQTTSADVTGSPLENTASGRSLNVQVLPSADTLQLVARSGTNPSPAGLLWTRSW